MSCVLAFTTTAQESRAQNLDEVTRAVIDKELDLVQMCTTLKLQTASQSQWRERRWFGYTVSNQTLTVAGALMNGVGRLYYRNMTRKAPKNLFINASWLRVIANGIAVAGCATEAALEAKQQWSERKSVGDLASYIGRARQSLASVDALINERSAHIAGEQNIAVKEIMVRENAILRDIRDCCADDLEEGYLRAKTVRASRYFQYAWVGASNLAGGAGTLANNLAAIRNRSSRANWPGGVGDTLSGSMNAVTPEIVRYAGRISARTAAHPLTAELSVTSKDWAVKKLDVDMEAYRSAVLAEQNESTPAATTHKNVYEVEGRILGRHFSTRPKPIKGTVGRVVGNFGSAVGGAGKVTNGIEVLVGSYRYPTDATKRFENFGAGGVAYGAGTAVAEEETIRREIISEVKWHKLPKAQRPAQILKDELQQLANARSDLKTESAAGY